MPAPPFLKKFLRAAIGNNDEFSLESRIFHSLSILAFTILPLQIIFNLIVGLWISGSITFMVLLIQSGLYYLSRVKGKLNLAVTISGIEIVIFTGLNYFFNSGIAGGTLLLYAMSLFMVMSVSPKKQWGLWLFLNLTAVIALTVWEYYNPGVIKIQYVSRKELFIDIVGTYIIVIVLLYTGTSAIRNNYLQQKQLSDEKTHTLELLNAEKDKLFSIISHDLRSPLAMTQQYFSALKDIEMNNEERQLLEKELINNITNTQDLLTNLLNWAKKRMEDTAPQLISVDVRQLLLKKAEVYASIALKKNIRLTTVTDDKLTVKADVNMLKLIIRNLLNNAVKFTPAGGYIELKAVKDKDQCVISVSDNGTGIPLNRQNSIFTLKASSTYGTENEKGTGLGLVLCKDYTLLQGGKIWFTSIENQGTIFYVSLPCAT